MQCFSFFLVFLVFFGFQCFCDFVEFFFFLKSFYEDMLGIFIGLMGFVVLFVILGDVGSS